MIWEVELTPRDLTVQVLIINTTERELPTKQGKEKDTCGPDVSRRTRVFSFHDDLRTHIARRSTEDFQGNIRAGTAAKAEINQFNLVLGHVNDNVLQFDITMCHVPFMQVAQSRQ